MAVKTKEIPQQPLILRIHRLMEAFSKADDEREFYIDRQEGFLIYVDLDKPQAEIEALERELSDNAERYCLIPKLSFYETKRFMEGFVNEKIYDVDTKEKLLDIIQSKEARANFLEFLSDHHAELEKWQSYYQERSRIRLIDWLRQNHFYFVFEEDLDFIRSILEGLKQSLYLTKVSRDIHAARKTLIAKAKLYYSTEALNPKPKRGRPPKQMAKQEIEPQITSDIYISVPAAVRPFLFMPEILTVSALTFSSDFSKSTPPQPQHEASENGTRIIRLPPLPKLKMDEEEEDWSESDDEEDEIDEEIDFLESKKAKPVSKLKEPAKIQKSVKGPPQKTQTPTGSKSVTKVSKKSALKTASDNAEKSASKKVRRKRILPVATVKKKR